MPLIRRIRDLAVELRRRHVFRVAVVYVVAAWAIVEVTSTIFPTLEIPAWTVRFVIVMAVLGFPVAIILAWAFELTPDGVTRTPAPGDGARSLPDHPDSGHRSAAGAEGSDDGVITTVAEPGREPLPPPPAGPSIGVLPFANLSADPENDYFSDGITEDLIAQLARVRSLKVISRTSMMSYKGTAKTVRTIGRELGVTSVLEGSVRRAGNRVRIVAQLVDAASDDHLWSGTYDRDLDDIFALQAEVAREITKELEGPLELGPDASGEARRGDPAAYDLYLRGRHAMRRRTPAELRRAVGLFEASLRRDPSLAPALAGLGEARFLLGVYGAIAPHEAMPRAREAARGAIEADPRAAEPLATLASIRAMYDLEWAEAEVDFRTAIEVAPGHAVTHHWFGAHLLTPLSRHEEARASLDRALELDPISPAIRVSAGLLDHFGGRAEQAVSVFRRLVETEPEFGAAHYFLGRGLLLVGRPEEAVAELERARLHTDDAVEPLAALGRALAAVGRERAARELLRDLEARARREWVSPVRIAELHVGLDQPERALDELERALDARAVDLVWLDVAPEFDDLRDWPRFRALRARVFGSHASEATRGAPGP